MNCIHELFEAQARRTPSRPAVSFEDQTLTYAELNRRADVLAGRLRECGAQREVLIGLYVERSLDMIVGLLGILKSDAAYVPLDPSFPRDRLDYMIHDARLGVVVTQHRLAERLAAQTSHVVEIDRFEEPPSLPGARRLQPSVMEVVGPDNVAYVIYTSGSTGRPKGVQVLHGAVVNFLGSMQREPGCTSADVLVAVTTLSFDIAVLELLLPLVTGGRLVLASRAVATDGRALQALMGQAGVTIMQATPSTWRLLIESGWAGTKGLKILCGGEALPRSLANALLDRSAELWNMYGPTETTIWSAVHRVTSREGVVPIGRPIAKTILRVLDESRGLVTTGEPGELYIGGAGLARGYLDRPELTGERFVRDPFSDDPAVRIYRTGDLVRVSEAGDLEFLGRIDHQVKISGYRIELGELEAVLDEHAEVLQAVVCARSRGDDTEQRLVAYVVLRGPMPHVARELRAHLARKLPSYMIPAAFVAVDSLPKTPNGKIDRARLPEPDWSQAFDQQEYAAPRTHVERELASIWQRVLRLDTIGIRDNFFDLGASSLDGARLLAEMETRFGNRLPLGALFKAPTIEQFATLLVGGAGRSPWTSLVPVQPNGSKRPLFCVHGGAGTIYLFRPLSQHLGTDQPLYALQARGLYGGEPPHRRVEEMATHYVAEMRSVQPEGPYAIGGYCFGGIVAYEMAQQLVAAGQNIALLALFNAPSYLYYKAQGGDQRMFRSEDPDNLADVDISAKPEVEASRLKRVYWSLAKELRTHAGFHRLQWRAVHALGLPVPERLRDYFFRLNNSRAEREYVARPYAGQMILFRAERLERDPLLGWGELVLGGVRSHAVQANDNQREIMAEPWVRHVAETLSQYLDGRVTEWNYEPGLAAHPA